MVSDLLSPAESAIGVSERIQAHHSGMSSAMLKIAGLLLAEPTAPLELSITELADRAGVSAATVTRFCREIGYPGYVQLRVAVAADRGRGVTADVDTWRLEVGRTLDPDDTPSDVLRTLLNAHVRSLRATATQLDLVQCAYVAAAISRCRHLDIYGTGGSATMAEEMTGRLYRIGIETHWWSDVHNGLSSASIQDKDCVAIGISNSGRTKETIEMVAEAKAAGAFTVAITSRVASPLGQLADACLVASVPARYLHPADLSAKHSQLFVLDLLYLLVTQENYTESISKIAVSGRAVASHRRPEPAGRTDEGTTR
ncbi:transcriptional regulator, RpiR family [Beutenbergia cavernae DSM 12333]|uniref:Transcriptional regulator, RpiR family n=1 Tax=Beutenbergia cavernae (strain ATCC BAA-8 / DSM 12333 / CCUG 43141 / JCM 11478 / NBRC 16432 / NCIMB 13614 / HKI 0122) TaxID=471853 RepID=C5C599_BEUC1|nr:MurR/RpiR family transcriptional regulator [Beutenbergia cavernae]ACQ82239.1 transcriptional regulator, RpiR family [Beutenbergia cavernae DSM 12333]